MATQQPKKKSHTGKVTLILIVLFAVGLAGFGYFSQTSELRNSTEAAVPEQAKVEPLPVTDPVFQANADDIVIGKSEAPITIVDYSSLSCPHCAHFHTEILPVVKKQLLDTGKAKLVFRHFPLNEPALRGAQLVDCTSAGKRVAMLDTLFAMQKNWAFTENFKDDLKKLAAASGMDAAQFDSCLADKESENAILATRQDAATRVGVNATPSFFVNGVAVETPGNAADFLKSVEAAAKPAEPKAK